jgi:hypothetical protein
MLPLSFRIEEYTEKVTDNKQAILKMKAVRSSETSVNVYQSTRSHIAGDSIFVCVACFAGWQARVTEVPYLSVYPDLHT